MPVKGHIVIWLFAASAIPGLISPAKATDRDPASKVSDHCVGRVLVSADFSSGEVIGYYSFLDGVPGSIFSGTPSEATAYFMLRSDTFSVQSLMNGPVTATLADPGTFTIYLNATPGGNWSNPDSFSSGQPIATFLRSEAMLTNAGPTALVMFSATLVSGVDFTFQGRTYNFNKLVPNGITHLFTASNTVLTGTGTFPLAFALAGSNLAIGSKLSALGPDAK